MPEALEDPTYGALAHANLLRLRGDWIAAREKTVAVMREFPNSGTAHSLMGDIFADQGLDEDAAQWYRMALELEPENTADKRKLVMVEKRLSAMEGLSHRPSGDDAPPAFSGFRVAAWAAGAFLVLVIALGLWLNKTAPRTSTDPAAPAERAQTPDRTASAPPAIGASPVEPGDRTQQESPSGDTSPPVAAAPPPAKAAIETMPGETIGEAELRNRLEPTRPTLARAGLALTSVQIDPRTNTLLVTLDGAGVEASDTQWMEASYYAASYLASTAFHLDRALNHAHLRIVMPLKTQGQSQRYTAFIGEVTRPAGFDTSPSQMLEGFERRWWHPGLTPPPAIATTP